MKSTVGIIGAGPADLTAKSAASQKSSTTTVTIYKALLHAVSNLISQAGSQADETSLIEAFHYPKYGPDQFWEETQSFSTR